MLGLSVRLLILLFFYIYLEEVFNSVGRCYLTKDGDTDCTGYVGRMLMLLTRNLNLSVINNVVKSCGVANAEGTRVSVIQKNVSIDKRYIVFTIKIKR